jgi:putative transposase
MIRTCGWSSAGEGEGAHLPEEDEIVRDGARQMLAAALEAEVAAYVEQFKDELDEHDRRLVVRNGFHAEREVTGSTLRSAWSRTRSACW